MDKEEKLKLDERIALFRYEQIIPVVNKTFPDKSADRYFRRIASSPLTYVDGTQITVSFQTLKHWYDLYRKEGFERLKPQVRSDRGKQRKLGIGARKRIYDLKKENPRLTSTNIYSKLIEEDLIRSCDVSLSTVTRYVATLGELKQSTIEDMRAFEMKNSNDLWQLDTTYCSKMKDVDGKMKTTYLIMIIDDHSRQIVGYGFFFEDNGVNVQSVIKSAISKYGVPKRLFTDNGAPYKNDQLKLICAKLQIEISRAAPYHGNQKGKIERAFRSVKEQWMYNTDFSQFNDLDELNRAFGLYVHKKNNTAHASLDGRTPSDVYIDGLNGSVRRVERSVLDKAFYHTITRKVAKDATIRLSNTLYETGQEYIGKTIVLKYIPDMSEVYIYDETEDTYTQIKVLNKVDNGKIRRNRPIFTGGAEQ